MIALLLSMVLQVSVSSPELSVSGYAGIQAALDANPGRVLFVPGGDYVISEPIQIRSDGSGLTGSGRIIQNNPDATIIEVVSVKDARIEGLTLTRPEGAMESTRHGVHARDCTRFVASGIRILDNRSAAGTLYLERCRDSAVRGSTVLNYKRISIDDRTGSEAYGYAFKVIDGTGILVTEGTGITISGNHVLEENIYPTEEMKSKYELGKLTDGRHPTKKGPLSPPGDYANNWHQGSGIVVTSPETTSHVIITDNVIRNAAQGIDMHADRLTCTNNVIDHAFVGIKCMHGSKNVIIAHNVVSHMDLWGLIMMPGAAAHPAQAATGERPAREANFTSGNIIAHNIFSDFGFGYEYFNWKDSKSGVIALQSLQLKEDPIMTDILVTGNIIYDTGKDQVLENGQPITVGPRYEWAVQIDQNPAPEGLRFSNNLFHPGRAGVSNVALTE